jgi:hypothetical protein
MVHVLWCKRTGAGGSQCCGNTQVTSHCNATSFVKAKLDKVDGRTKLRNSGQVICITSCWVAADPGTTIFCRGVYAVPERDSDYRWLRERRWHHAVPALRSMLDQRCRKTNASHDVSFLFGTRATGAQTSSTSVGSQKACFRVVLSQSGPHVPQSWLRSLVDLAVTGHAAHVESPKNPRQGN